MREIQPLDLLTVDEAQERLGAALARAGWAPTAERIPVTAALGRVTAAPVRARRPVPHYPVAAVDGLAVRAGQVPGALRIGAEAQPVNTGYPVEPAFDAVVMKEELRWSPDGKSVYVDRPTQVGKHIRATGSDATEGEELLPAGHPLRPVDLGALLAVGVSEIEVQRQPVIGFLPTGSELVEPGTEQLAPGQVIESNSAMLLGEVAGWGGLPLRHPIVPDEPGALRQAIRALLTQVDLLLIGGGSSQGSEDYTVHLLRELGQVLVHGVAMRPGKPVILAVVEGKPVIGLPGYPGASWLAARLFARPLLYQFQGLALPEPQVVKARLGAPVNSPRGLAHYVRVKLEPTEPTVHPFPPNAGAIAALVQADGLLLIPPEVIELPAGALIEVSRI